MHKGGKWAKDIIALQEEDGKWGWFHSLSQFYNSPITTEQALRRLERLGYTIEDECIEKAVKYMDDCLTGKKSIPDRREKLHNWDIFTSMILATWIRRFTLDNPNANKVAKQWSDIIHKAFSKGVYNHSEYVSAYNEIFGEMPSGRKPMERKPLQNPKPCTKRYNDIKKRLIGKTPVNLIEAEIKGRDDRPLPQNSPIHSHRSG